MEAIREINASAIFLQNQKWLPLDNGTDHISITLWPIYIILVSIIRFLKGLRPSVGHFETINQVLTKLQQDLVKYKIWFPVFTLPSLNISPS